MAPPKRPPEGARWDIPEWNPYDSEEEARRKTYLDQLEELRQELAVAQARVEQVEALNQALHAELERVNADSRGLRAELDQARVDQAALAAARRRVAETEGLAAQIRSREEYVRRVEAQAEGYEDEIASVNERLREPKRKIENLADGLKTVALTAGLIAGGILALILGLAALPLIVPGAAVYFYVREIEFRETANRVMMYALPACLIYFTVAGWVINRGDPARPCFRNGGSYLHCGFVRGVWRPVKAGGAWMLGLND